MLHRSFKLPLATILSLVALLASVQFAHAGSVVWNTSGVPTLYIPQGSVCTSLLHSTSVSVAYHADAANSETGEPVCGKTIPKGTEVEFKFAEHTWEDVYWNTTGYNYDTPYGDWSANASPPPAANYCTPHNFINNWGAWRPEWGRYLFGKLGAIESSRFCRRRHARGCHPYRFPCVHRAHVFSRRDIYGYDVERCKLIAG